MIEAKENVDVDNVAEANRRKLKAIRQLALAHEALCDAQDIIVDVEGDGSADIYNSIAYAYVHVRQIAEQLSTMQPTGLFE